MTDDDDRTFNLNEEYNARASSYISTAVISETEEEKKVAEEEEEEGGKKRENDEIVERKDKDEKVDDDTSEYLKEWPLGIQWEPIGIQKEKDPTDIIEVTTIRDTLHFVSTFNSYSSLI